MLNLKFPRSVPYFLAASLLVVALLLAACNGSGLGGGGDELPGATEGPSPGVTDEPLPEFTDEPSPEVREEFSPEVTEEPPLSGEMTQTGSIDSLELEANRITLLLDTGEAVEVNVDEYLTVVTINGANESLQGLQPGDVVEVVIDQATDTASAITMQSNSTSP